MATVEAGTKKKLQLSPNQVILRPLVTEKGMHRSERHNAYSFEVNRLATKDDIRQHLFEHATIEAQWLERYPLHVAGAPDSLERRVADGSAPARYAASSDPDRPVPVLLRPDWTGIIVAGDPGRNQSKAYVNNHEQGAPVTKQIYLPEDWDRRVRGPGR